MNYSDKSPSQSPTSWIFVTIRIFIAAACFYALSKSVDVVKTIELLGNIPNWVLVLTVVLTAARCLTYALRWYLVCPPETDVSLWVLTKIVFVCGALTIFFPGVAGSDVARGFLISQEAKSDTGGAILAVFFDRVIGFLSIIALAIISALLVPKLEHRLQYIICFFGVAVMLAVAILLAKAESLQRAIVRKLKEFGRIGEWIGATIESIVNALAKYRPPTKNIALAFLACVPIHVIWFLIVYLVAHSINIDIDFLTIAVVTSLVWLITVLPISFAGFGVREASFVFLLTAQGFDQDEAAVLAVYQSVVIVISSALGIPFLASWRNSQKNAAPDQDDHEPVHTTPTTQNETQAEQT